MGTPPPSRSHDSTARWVSTNERGETKLVLTNERGETSSSNERGDERFANERRRHRTPSTEENKAKLPALEEKVVWPVQELVAILGGVLGFWGGVGSMGALFLLVLMTQRFFCRRREDKKEGW